MEDPNSVNVAASLCGILKAVAVDVSIETAVIARGYTECLDVRGKNDAWLYDTYGENFTYQAMIAQNNNIDYLLDWGPAIQSPMLTGESKSLCDSIYDKMIPCSPRYGSWEKYADAADEGEYGNTSLMTQHGMYSGNFDGFINVPVYAGMVNSSPPMKFEQKAHETVCQKESDVHYVCIILTDTDPGYFNCNPENIQKWYASKTRGAYPIGWGITATMFKNTPTIAEYYYRNATLNDNFIAPMSGMGWMLTLESPCLDIYCQTLERHMEQADMRTVSIFEYAAVNTQEFLDDVVSEFNTIKNLRGLIIDGPGGKLSEGLWYKGKMVMPVTDFMTADADGNPVTGPDAAAVINSKTTDPNDMASYSIVYMGVLNHTIEDGLSFVNSLDSDVRIVTPDELMEQLYNNASMKNAGFEDPTISSRTSGTYAYPDKFYDWRVIDGTVYGGLDNSDVFEGSQHMWASLVSGASTETFTLTQPIEKAQAGFEYSLSLSVKQSSGTAGRVTVNLLVGNQIVASSVNEAIDSSWTEIAVPDYVILADEADEMVSVEIVAESTSGTSVLCLDAVSCEISLPGDVTGDGVVDRDDLLTLSENWLLEDAEPQQGDLNGDLKVNLLDFAVLADRWLNAEG